MQQNKSENFCLLFSHCKFIWKQNKLLVWLFAHTKKGPVHIFISCSIKFFLFGLFVWFVSQFFHWWLRFSDFTFFLILEYFFYLFCLIPHTHTFEGGGAKRCRPQIHTTIAKQDDFTREKIFRSKRKKNTTTGNKKCHGVRVEDWCGVVKNILTSNRLMGGTRHGGGMAGANRRGDCCVALKRKHQRLGVMLNGNGCEVLIIFDRLLNRKNWFCERLLLFLLLGIFNSCVWLTSSGIESPWKCVERGGGVGLLGRCGGQTIAASAPSPAVGCCFFFLIWHDGCVLIGQRNERTKIPLRHSVNKTTWLSTKKKSNLNLKAMTTRSWWMADATHQWCNYNSPPFSQGYGSDFWWHGGSYTKHHGLNFMNKATEKRKKKQFGILTFQVSSLK